MEPLDLFGQIDRDLGRYRKLSAFQRSLYANFCAQRQRACITLRIVEGVAFVLDLFPGYQSRHRATLHAVHRALQRLGPVPDVEVVIDVTDGELQKVDLPILVITHRLESPAGILYPDFTFFSWPESACPPGETSHAHALLMERYARNWTQRAAPWVNRSQLLFWRGAPVDDDGRRARALEHLAEVGGTDAAFVRWQATSVTGENQVPGCVGLLEHCRYRYLAFLAGTTYSSRLKYQLLCGSTVLAAVPEFGEWWTGLLRPGGHYAEVARDWHDAGRVLAALRADPGRARAIAARGQRLALSALTTAAVDCYWWRLLAAAAEVLPPPLPGPLPRHARPLDDVLLWPDGVGLSGRLGVPFGGPPPEAVQ